MLDRAGRGGCDRGGLARRLSKSSVSYLASTDAAYWAAFSRFVAILSARTLADCAQFELAHEISAELARARTKFPDPVGSMRALTQEVGDLAKAILDESPQRVREEAVQTAVMAIRVGTEGDPSLDGVRARPAARADRRCAMTGRYVTALRNGRKCRVRDPEVLERDILALLTARGPMPQRQIAGGAQRQGPNA
ncbi:MAG: hypothetical protein WDN30_07655 [Pararobbsia sp.]